MRSVDYDLLGRGRERSFFWYGVDPKGSIIAGWLVSRSKIVQNVHEF